MDHRPRFVVEGRVCEIVAHRLDDDKPRVTVVLDVARSWCVHPGRYGFSCPMGITTLEATGLPEPVYVGDLARAMAAGDGPVFELVALTPVRETRARRRPTPPSWLHQVLREPVARTNTG